MAGVQKKKLSVSGWLGAYAVILLVMGILIKSIYPAWANITKYCNLGAYVLFIIAFGSWIYSIVSSAKAKATSRVDLSKQIGELFVNLNLKGGTQYPSLLKKYIQDNEATYYYHLPAGLTLSDITKRKEAFEQYLNHKIKVYIEDRMIVIKVETKY